MELVEVVLLFFSFFGLDLLHLLGAVGVIAGSVQQLKGSPKGAKTILYSSLLQLVTGLLLLAGVGEPPRIADIPDTAVDHIEAAVKLVFEVTVTVIAIVNVRKPVTRLAVIAGVLAVANVGVAAFV